MLHQLPRRAPDQPLRAQLAFRIAVPVRALVRQLRGQVRQDAEGLGLLAGVEFRLRDGKPATAIALEITKQMLHRGFIVLPEGEHSNVLGFTPPLTLTRDQLNSAVNALEEVWAEVQGG